MTRIFDALKKAEATRETAAGPADAARRAPFSSADVATPEVLPLVGSVELVPEVARELATLRVSVETTLRERVPRVVMFLGAQGGEGVSTVALQFAQTLAADSALRPLLMDCHARRPAYLKPEGQRHAVLAPHVASRPVTGEEGPSPNLFVVPVPEAYRVAGMIQAAALRQMLEVCTRGFDWVVLDGPPVLAAPDASALAAVADAALMVVQAGRSKRPVLARAAALLGTAGARTLGSVLNRRVMEIPGFIYKRI